MIILDEFQRFKHLLDEESEASQLARELFDWTDQHSDAEARVVLLSATPYKMYTMAHEAESEDHYQDFRATLRFLDPSPEAATAFDRLLKTYRTELYQLSDTGEVLTAAKDELERRLRRIMCRTERLAVSADRSGMLREMPVQLQLKQQDLGAYRELQRVARLIDHGDTIEYWKSSPYPLNFMSGYQLKQRIRRAAQGGPEEPQVTAELAKSKRLLLRWDTIEAYEPLDPLNARCRWLLDETVAKGAWRLLWLAPSLPYYQQSGPWADEDLTGLTKRLIFSAWRVVPKALAAMLSYEAERQMLRSFEESPINTAEARAKRRGLLRFTEADGRLTGMPLLSLLYPSVVLSGLGDPLEFIGANGGHLRAPEEVLNEVTQRIQELIAPRLAKAPSEGPDDEKWYWALPIMLDYGAASEDAAAWWQTDGLARLWSGVEDEEDTAWSRHIEEAEATSRSEGELGRPPDDLAEVLALLSLAAPANVAYRALCRLGEPASVKERTGIRFASARIAWGFRSLFNLPESMALIRGFDSAEPYWRRALEYCFSGNLQAVLDEYVHQLQDSLGLRIHPLGKRAEEISKVIAAAVAMRTATAGVDHIAREPSGKVSFQPKRMRTRFALAYGDDKADSGDENLRAETVREAFNSPFWPFVLATTSVGQEGLDFHPYCHAVVHWNLPSNPVDLEQREGRVHRYKGHAVRKSLGARYGRGTEFPRDPWEGIFAAAVKDRPEGDSDLVPFWVHRVEGGAQIERYVPAMPLSRDLARLVALRKSLAVYRMVFGQPRQDDLVEYLLTHLTPDQVATRLDAVQINLQP